MLSVPILIGSFILYWKKCITWGYDVFAICEYAGVFLNIAYHGCAFFDIRYKVVFSVRLVETIEPEESANRLEMKKPSPQEETVK
ncbi:hypothetical protein QR680_003271 [Steinernema hermaphroditum]|uniref:CWH43-like N-terminal domain-containing protein n=1 Tax=Steinernema hermaphroditum TaxID=289476 RepID=A0AA39H722_9BILA|nr:hypothetical protein QR680_003271 [Steinernema hermaphroditum]